MRIKAKELHKAPVSSIIGIANAQEWFETVRVKKKKLRNLLIITTLVLFSKVRRTKE